MFWFGWGGFVFLVSLWGGMVGGGLVGMMGSMGWGVGIVVWFLLMCVESSPGSSLRPALRGLCVGSHRSDEYVLVALKLEGKEAEERKRREKEEEERRIKEKLDIEFGQKLAGAMAKAFDHLLLIYGDLVGVMMSYAEENREEVPDTRPQTVSLFKQCQMDPSSPLIDPLTDGIVEECVESVRIKATTVKDKEITGEMYSLLEMILQPFVKRMSIELMIIHIETADTAVREGASKAMSKVLCALVQPALISAIRRNSTKYGAAIRPYLRQNKNHELDDLFDQYMMDYQINGESLRPFLQVDICKAIAVYLPNTSAALLDFFQNNNEEVDLPYVISSEIGSKLGEWLSDIIDLRQKEREELIEFLESYSVYVQEKHKEKAAQDDGVVYIPKVDKAPQMKSTMMPAISSALKRVFQKSVVSQFRGSPFFQIFETMSKHLVEMRGGRGGREEYGESGQYDFQSSPRGTYTSHASPPASPRGSLDLDDPEMFDDEEDFKSLPKGKEERDRSPSSSHSRRDDRGNKDLSDVVALLNELKEGVQHFSSRVDTLQKEMDSPTSPEMNQEEALAAVSKLLGDLQSVLDENDVDEIKEKERKPTKSPDNKKRSTGAAGSRPTGSGKKSAPPKKQVKLPPFLETYVTQRRAEGGLGSGSTMSSLHSPFQPKAGMGFSGVFNFGDAARASFSTDLRNTTTAAVLEAHRLQGATFQVLEKDIPRVMKGLQVCLKVVQSMIKSSDKEVSALVWFIRKLVENKKLKSMQTELSDVAFLLKVLVQILGSCCTVIVILLDALAHHLPNIISGSSDLADSIIKQYLEEASSSLKSSVWVDRNIYFWEMLVGSVVKAVQASVAEIDLFSGSATHEELLQLNLKETLAKDILLIAFNSWKEEASTSLVSEITAMCRSEGQKDRVHKFLHLSLDIANSAFIYMANKLEQIGSRVWEDVEFWPDCIAEGVTIWIFSGFDKIGLRPSDMLLKPLEAGSKSVRHQGAIQLFNAINETIYKVMSSWEDPSLDMGTIDLDKPINFSPYQAVELLKDLSSKIVSSALVIQAVQENSTTVSMATHMALSDAYTRHCVESFLDNAIFSVIGTLDNLSSSLNLHSQLLQKVLDYLNDQSRLKQSLKEIGLDLQFAFSPYFQEKYKHAALGSSFPSSPPVSPRSSLETKILRFDPTTVGFIVDHIHAHSTLVENSRFLDYIGRLINGAQLDSPPAPQQSGNWFSFSLYLFQKYAGEVASMLESAMTFLSPVAFLMVGKGQPIKPQAVRKIGEELLLGPLYDLHYRKVGIRDGSRICIEEVRNIRSRLLSLQGKIYAGQNASHYSEKGPNAKNDRDTRQLLPEVVARSKTLSSAAFLNEKDIKDVLYNLPKQMEEMSPVRVKRELEPVLREMALENGVRTQRFKKSWTEEDEDAYLKKMSDLFCEAFLLRSAVVALKYDLKERLVNVQKLVLRALQKREKLTDQDLVDTK